MFYLPLIYQIKFCSITNFISAKFKGRQGKDCYSLHPVNQTSKIVIIKSFFYKLKEFYKFGVDSGLTCRANKLLQAGQYKDVTHSPFTIENAQFDYMKNQNGMILRFHNSNHRLLLAENKLIDFRRLHHYNLNGEQQMYLNSLPYTS